MSLKKILALSSSRAGNEDYLATASYFIKNFLGNSPLKIAFIPFALVSKNYAEYESNVISGLSTTPYEIKAVDHANAKQMIEQCDAIMVGGGNTFKLLHDLYRSGILETIRQKVGSGTPYIGWSAGSNILSPGIGTTNDMPIIQPLSFAGLNLFPFQVNPHYYNQKPEGFNGETRNQRLFEFVTQNPSLKVVGLPEGSALELKDNVLKYLGNSQGVLIYNDESGNPLSEEITPGKNLSFLL